MLTAEHAEVVQSLLTKRLSSPGVLAFPHFRLDMPVELRLVPIDIGCSRGWLGEGSQTDTARGYRPTLVSLEPVDSV